MKITFTAICFILLIFSLEALENDQETFDDAYAALCAGYGGSSKGTSLGVDVTAFDDSYVAMGSLGLFILWSPHEVPSRLFEYPCPTENYTIIGMRQKDLEYGGVLRLGSNFGLYEPVHFYALAGWSFRIMAEVAKSDTGNYYTQSEDYQGKGNLGIGVNYIFRQGKNHIFTEYELRRGFVLGIGIRLSGD